MSPAWWWWSCPAGRRNWTQSCGLVAAEVNIQYTYSLMIRPNDKALLALHCEDSEFARDVLLKEGHSVLSQKDISR